MPDRELPSFDVDAIGDAVRQPPLADLYRAAARRRQRRVAGTALVLVAALAMAVVPFAARGPAGQSAGPGLSESQPAGPTVSELFVFGETSAVGVEVADDGCSIRFGRTQDLGLTWSEFRPLRYETPCRSDAEGQGSDIRYHPLSLRTYLASVDSRSYLSTDEGRTWQDADASISVVDAFPPGADPVDCLANCIGLAQPLAVDPDTGEVFSLRGEPPSPYRLDTMYESADGALWTTYWPGDGLAVVARSADRGATWQTARMPEQFTTGANPLRPSGLAAESAQVAYLTAEPAIHDPTRHQTQLFRTSDGGRTWHDLGTDLPTSEILRPITVGADQSLLVADTDQASGYVWVSHDGGRHFAKGPAVGAGALGAAPGQAWIVVAEDGAHLTSDGTTWKARLAFPSR